MRPLPKLPLAAGLSLLVSTTAQAADDDLRINSIGYVSTAAKRATVLGAASGDFVIRWTTDDSEAFAGTLTGVGADGVADFSALETPGSYYLEVAGVGRSPDFPVGPDAYVEPFRTAMLGLYAWRSGVDVSLTYEGQTYAHQAGHTDDARLDFVGQPGVVKDATGGWYDAGDYGKYIVNSALTMGALLEAWEDFQPALARLSLQIPENDNTQPDYLDELRFQLDWMLKMQFDDGSVSHKLTPVDFAGFVLPADDPSVRYLSPAGTAATAGFTATLAKAARAFEPYDPDYAATLLAAAERSYQYLTEHPDNQRADLSDFGNAQYQTDDPDDRIWAAAEIWETTGSTPALADFEARIAAFGFDVYADWDWGDQANFGVFTYLESTRPNRDATVVTTLEDALRSTADELVANASSRYGRAIQSVYWGSNGTVARNCITLHVAARRFAEPAYLDTCADQIAHLFGRNEYRRSQVTGLGLEPPRFPHDRRSSADGIAAPYPGYLVGGASSEGNWEDVEESYSTNEIAINWQGALVYALAGFLPEIPNTGGTGGDGTGGGGATSTGGSGAGDTGGVGAGDASGGAPPTGGAGSAASPAAGAPTSETGGGLTAESRDAADGGCGCRATSRPSPGGLWLALVLALGILRHRSPAARGRGEARR